MKPILFAACAALTMLCAPAHAETGAPDYANPESWACLPGHAGLCDTDLTTTVVAADGALATEAFAPSADPAIDCFYVYPTVSNDPGGNSDMRADAEERYVVAQQFARFAAVCRPFAPLYRQVTLTALRGLLTGRPIPSDPAMAYADVKAAWETYLARHNEGRGVLLVGHSQGAGLLTALVAREIEGKPVAARMVAAYLIGANVPVPRGGVVGGAFKSTPLCAQPDQTGCVVSYVSFRETAPPPPSSRFGAAQMNAASPAVGGDVLAACVNPAALSGGAAPLRSYLAATSATVVSPAPGPTRTWAAGKSVETPFVATPGLLSAQCQANGTHQWLSVRVNADPADPRTDDIPGDVIANGVVLADWGLHLVDMNIAMGDLVDLAGRQGAAYARANR
ncbi:MAG: DUF3089 domain-containing protein [Hyphomonadaceae bacterium]|nr:DUF3089 domain-containing protein [Hyphomonadaceae bacterium]